MKPNAVKVALARLESRLGNSAYFLLKVWTLDAESIRVNIITTGGKETPWTF